MSLDNIKLTIAYDGSHYLGWQKNKQGPSIEQTLQDALELILQHKVKLQAATRTDAGVHAAGQIVNFFCHKTEIRLDRLLYRINGLIPRDIVVLEVKHEADNFHPTLDCLSKEYHYWICASRYQLPFYRTRSWHIHEALDFQAMREAAESLIGRHDFSSFTNVKKNESYEDHIRKVQMIEIVEHPEQRVQIKISGNNFLYKMVRNIVGTLIYVGMGKIKSTEVAGILLSRNRILAGVTAPAHGLTLFKVYYHEGSQAVSAWPVYPQTGPD